MPTRWSQLEANISSCSLLPAPCFLLPATCILPFLLPFLLPLQDAASRCRLAKQNHRAVQYCRRRDCRCRAESRKFGFFCSLFTAHCEAVAVWQNKITVRYNIDEEGTAGVEGIAELKLVSHCAPSQGIGCELGAHKRSHPDWALTKNRART